MMIIMLNDDTNAYLMMIIILNDDNNANHDTKCE